LILEEKPKKKYSNKFTPKQKKEYKEKKEKEKKELFELYKSFLEKKTIKEIVGIISDYKQMHNYSFRNRMMIYAQSIQRLDGKFVGICNSFVNWKKQDIKVLQGSIGYKVLVPIFKKVEEEEEENGDITEKTILSHFKIGHVFDISQTTEYEKYLEERKAIDEQIMNNAEIDYKIALEFVNKHFTVLEIIENIRVLSPEDEKGSYNPISKVMTLNEESGHTVFHELGHHVTFVLGIEQNSYAKNEILAELFAYALMQKFDDNIDYNFNYSNVWSSRIEDTFDFKDFEKCYQKISNFIDKLDFSNNNGGGARK